jgi:putative nucleotidyltransferase with HDIG domain
LKEIKVNHLKVGDILAGSICCDHSYKLLLNKGTVITAEHLNKLKKYNYYGLCLVAEERDVAGVRLDLLNQLGNDKIKRAYLDMFVISKSIFENLEKGNPINIELAKETVDVVVEQIMDSSNIVLQLAAVHLVDDYTLSHMINVALYSGALAKCLNYSIQDIKDICFSGLLHDVGKAKIPKEILRKPDSLTPEEFSITKKHAEQGYQILCQEELVNDRVRQVALQHHERGDGSGYPYGLHHQEITLFSRLIAIADVYDALTSDRCYRGRVLPHESAEILMADCTLNRLDTELVKAFLKYIILYPLGTRVILSDGRLAQVIKVHADFPLRPVLEILEDDTVEGGHMAGIVDMISEPTIFIKQILS